MEKDAGDERTATEGQGGVTGRSDGRSDGAAAGGEGGGGAGLALTKAVSS